MVNNVAADLRRRLRSSMSAISTLDRLHAEIAACRKCALAGYFVEPSPVVVSRPPGRPELMLVGQAPASAARSKGRPFSGQAGRVLFGWLARAGFDEESFRARCYFTAVTKCYPGPARAAGRGKGDRVPTAVERALCAPFLERELALIQPKLIITVGRVALASFLGNAIAFTPAIGQRFERDGRILLPLPHPSGVSRWINDPQNRARLDVALDALRHIITHEL